MHKFINRARSLSKGFTLIELLVVIAIIALLASIILVSLNSARKKGNDTRVISDVDQTRTQFEQDINNAVYQDLYNITASQTDVAGSLVTAANANITTLANDINSYGGAAVVYYVNTNSTAGSATVPNVSAYAIYGKTSTGYYCVDSNGLTLTNTTGGTIPAAGAATISCH